MRISVELVGFAELHQNIIPYVQALDTERIMTMLVDDLNGLLNMSVDKLEKRHVNISGVFNTITYLCADAASIISANGIEELKHDVVNLLYAIFDELRGQSDWINMRFVYMSHREVRSGSWILRMKGVVCHHYNAHDRAILLETADALLENINAKTNSRR